MTKAEMIKEVDRVWGVMKDNKMEFKFLNKLEGNLKVAGIKKYYVCISHKKVDIESYLEQVINTVYDLKMQDLVW